jgi:hypothetical protein
VYIGGWDKAYAECLKLGQKIGVDEVLENGLLGKSYDNNGDGKLDVLTLSHSEESMPLFYIVDENKDGEPDKVFIDRFGDCALVLYQDLTIPHDTGLNFQHPLETQGREI